VAVSPQTIAGTDGTRDALSLAFTLLRDPGNEAARTLGLVFALPVYLRPVYEKFGIDLPAANGDETFELPIPATYVIDQAGTVRWAHVDLDYRTRAEPADILGALDALD
jgi:peroxiredoxin